MSLSKNKCWFSNNCLQFFKARCSITYCLLACVNTTLRKIVGNTVNITLALFYNSRVIHKTSYDNLTMVLKEGVP
jgi:hypothetical protein